MGWVQCVLLLEDAQQNPMTTDWMMAALISDFRNVHRTEGAPAVSASQVLGLAESGSEKLVLTPEEAGNRKVKRLSSEQVQALRG